ncbi:MAG: tetratricopeptide repeat protein [Synechococcaceae cyanobacterium]|nr:tetratricopeptide repeat protein [Synechococcaceae cyanobacterium]
MRELLPQAYLLGLIVLLAGAAFVVARQILRVRRDESTLARLGSNDGAGGPALDSAGLYELASVQLRKRLYGQATDNLRQALRRASAENAPPEAVALIENALGFAHAAQGRFPSAVRHYRSALRSRADYPVALNNLAFALEKQGKEEEARSAYEQALALDPDNRTARRGIRSLERRSTAAATSG